ncbi:TPA: hypothetical protein HA318_05980 [Candidatus Micrarchaeota archaeon]|nr:hypothetical protein [Candidatus Micrarchaeota archaeon]
MAKQVASIKQREAKALEALKQGFVREYVAVADAAVDKLLLLIFASKTSLSEYHAETLYKTGATEGAKLAEFLLQTGALTEKERNKVREFKNYRNYVLHQHEGEWSALIMKNRALAKRSSDAEPSEKELETLGLTPGDFAEHAAKHLQAAHDLVALLCSKASA